MRSISPITRRSLLGSAAALPFSWFNDTRVRAAQLRPVTLRLDWFPQGPNYGFMVAREKGFYGAAGLDVDIGGGKGSGNTAQLVASKATQFGFADGYVVANSVARGLNIKMVASVFRRNPAGVVVLEDSAIKQLSDVEGKQIAIPAGSAQFQQWPAVVRGCNLDGGKVRVVNLDTASVLPAILSGQVQALAGFAQGYVPTIEIRGNKKARVFWYSDCGVNAVSNGIIVHADLIRDDPALVTAFVKSSLMGFLYGREHPDEVPLIVKKYYDPTDLAVCKREMELSWTTWVPPHVRDKPARLDVTGGLGKHGRHP
jgi:NitT/TauT family transport system substrate-binding protein